MPITLSISDLNLDICILDHARSPVYATLGTLKPDSRTSVYDMMIDDSLWEAGIVRDRISKRCEILRRTHQYS